MIFDITTFDGLNAYFVILTVSLFSLVVAKNISGILKHWKWLMVFIPLLLLYALYLGLVAITIYPPGFSIAIVRYSLLNQHMVHAVYSVFVISVIVLSSSIPPIKWILRLVDICRMRTHNWFINLWRTHIFRNNTKASNTLDDAPIDNTRDDRLGFTSYRAATMRCKPCITDFKEYDVILDTHKHILYKLDHDLVKDIQVADESLSQELLLINNNRDLEMLLNKYSRYCEAQGLISKGYVDEFYEKYVSSRFNKSKNTIIILDSVYGIGKSSFLNLLCNKVKEINYSWGNYRANKIKEIKFSAATLLAECSNNNNTDTLYKFLRIIQKELRGTANYELFKYTISGYVKHKFGVDFSFFWKESFHDIRTNAGNCKQKIILIIEDLDRVNPKDLWHVIRFLWHIKELPYMVTILPAQAQILYPYIEYDESFKLQAEQNINQTNQFNTIKLPRYSQNYHKLIDDVYHLTDKVYARLCKWLWSANSDLYDKSDDIIPVQIHKGNSIPRMQINDAKVLHLDDEYIKFNGQLIKIADLCPSDIAKVDALKVKSIVNYKELLFLPLKMLNFWQNTTIYQDSRHEGMFVTILQNIIRRFRVSTREIKKIIKLFKEGYNDCGWREWQGSFKDKNISDVLIYCLIEVRYKHYLNHPITQQMYSYSYLEYLKYSILGVFDGSGIRLQYDTLPKEIIDLLEYTSSYSKALYDVNMNTGLFDFHYTGRMSFCNNEDNNQNCSDAIYSNSAHYFMEYVAHNKHLNPSKCQYLLFMFYHRWLVLNDEHLYGSPVDNINTLYKLTTLKFFEKDGDYNCNMTDTEIGYCFGGYSACCFAILYVVNYDQLQLHSSDQHNDYIKWMTRNIAKIFTYQIPWAQHTQHVYTKIFQILFVRDCSIQATTYSNILLVIIYKHMTWCIRDDVSGDELHNIMKQNIYIKLGMDEHYENLETTIQQFLDNINTICNFVSESSI